MSSARLDPAPVMPALAMPAEWAAYADYVDDVLFEAAACGDPGLVDRVFTARCDGPDEGPPPGWPGAGSRAVDPLEIVGPVAWLGLAAREQIQADARFLAAVHAIGHHDGHSDEQGRPVRDAFAADEIARARGWSTAKAAYWLGLSEAVIDRLPALWAAMERGELDLGKVKTIAAATRALPVILARTVVSRVLAVAASVSDGDLETRIAVAAVELDPGWVARRERAALARVRLEGTRNPEGTADVALRDLDAETGARIRARIDGLAGPVRRTARAGGVTVGIGLVRALIGQRLWDGTYAGIDDDTLIAALADELPTWLAALHGDDPDSGPDASGPDDSGPGDTGPGDPDDGPGDKPGDGPDAPEPSGDETPPESQPSRPSQLSQPVGGAVRRGTVELRMRLTTALSLDDLPAQLVGQGVLTAGSARRMLTTTRQDDVPVETRLVLVDDDGHLEHVLLTPLDRPARGRRPGPRRERGQTRGQVIVELAAPTTLLAAVDPDQHPRWARWLRQARKRLGGLRGTDADLGGPEHPATTLTDAAHRFPGRELERYVRVRDRHCISPTCSGVAHRAEIDHTRDWARFGLTVAANLGTPCAHCHRLKHEGGWHLDQPRPGRFVWHTRLGATYTVEPRRVLEPPLDPAPTGCGTRPARAARRPSATGRAEWWAEWWAERRPRVTVAGPVPSSGPGSRRARGPDPDDTPPPF